MTDLREPKALVTQESMFAFDRVRLHLFANGKIINERAEWVETDETARNPESGIIITETLLPHIVKAIERHMGKLTDSTTEAAVLREWLAIEQRRVDQLIDASIQISLAEERSE